jgi:hypothetical protein
MMHRPAHAIEPRSIETPVSGMNWRWMNDFGGDGLVDARFKEDASPESAFSPLPRHHD